MKKIALLTIISLITAFISLIELQASNIISLSSLEKDEKKIYIIGVDPLKPSTKELPEFSLYKNLLATVSLGHIKTAFLLFDSKNAIKKSIEKDAPYNFHTCISQEALTNNFQSGALEYLTLSQEEDESLQRVVESIHFLIKPRIMVSMGHLLGLPKNPHHPLEPFFSADIHKNKPLFQPKEPFDFLKKTFITIAHQNPQEHPSIKEYFDLLEKHNQRITALPDNALFTPLKKEWARTKEAAQLYLKFHSNNRLDLQLIEIFLYVIEKKQSFSVGIEEFQTVVYSPLSVIKTIANSVLVFQTLETFDKVLFYYQFNYVKDFIRSLEKIGFKADFQGILPEAREFLAVNDTKTVFSNVEIVGFFLSIMQNRHHLPSNPLVDVREASSVLSYYDPQSGSLSHNSIKNHSLELCGVCNHSIEACSVYAQSEKKIYCSLTCMLNKLFQEEKTSHKLSLLLDEKHVLSLDEKLILKQFGALCYLRAALLMPSITQEYGIVYQLTLSSIINALKLIETTAKDTQTPWGETLQLAQHWGIRMPDLTLFLSAYKITKQNYLQSLLKDSLYKKYSELLGEHHTLFDEKNSCITLQKVAFTNIKKALTLGVSTKDISVLFLYNDLIEQINNRVGLPVESIRELLAVTYPHQDLTKALEFIGYTENPFTSKKNKKDRVILPSLIDDTFEDEESLDENIEGSFIQESSPLNSLHTINPSVETDFETVTRRQKKVVRTLKSSFAGGKPYTISLFKARKCVPQELQKAQAVWKQCKKTVESHRIKTLFALADILQDQNPVINLNSFGCLALDCTTINLDESIKKKLDLDHLFTRLVDLSLRSYGIAEIVDNLIQVSIPGEITDDQGIKKIGFFQYSFTSDTGICIHRCFKQYDANQNDTYISISLRKILFHFLKEFYDTNEYKKVINHLEQLIAQGK
ncbi:hypothetical protein H0X06_05035 [Candidatus Dependentiae bacterium]|nr:hypothetical protein [Candidatus Dependentiae bacterium]